LAGIEPRADNRRTAEALEKLDISQSLSKLKADRLLRQLIQLTKDDRKAALDSFTRLAENFSNEEKAALLTVLKPGESQASEAVKILTICERSLTIRYNTIDT
jgi:acetyl-CoA carboxylase/biotin carboxylase 1